MRVMVKPGEWRDMGFGQALVATSRGGTTDFGVAPTQAGRRRCNFGHPLDGRERNGRRVCLTCARGRA